MGKYVEILKTSQLFFFVVLKLGFSCGKESHNHWFSFLICPFDHHANIVTRCHQHDNLRGYRYPCFHTLNEAHMLYFASFLF